MDPLAILRSIKSVTFSTVEDGAPKARIIDVMFIEDNKIFFLTARGKSFYRQLLTEGQVAVTGMDEQYNAVRIHGRVQKTKTSLVDRIFEENPMMNDIYPGEKRDILESFVIDTYEGEVLSLGRMPLKRIRFSSHDDGVIEAGYTINGGCVACGICEAACPENCISHDETYRIDPTGCIECGRCFERCPQDAIDKPNRF